MGEPDRLLLSVVNFRNNISPWESIFAPVTLYEPSGARDIQVSSWMASLNCLETLKVEQWASSYTRDCGSFIKSDDMTKTLDSLWQCMIRGDKGTCCQNSTGSSVPARTCCSATYEASQKGVTEALFAGYGAIQRLFCSEHCIRTPWTVFETSTLWLVSRPLARSWQDSYAERWWCYVEFFIILFLFFLFLLLRFLSLLLI